jgi:hypothetical protein
MLPWPGVLATFISPPIRSVSILLMVNQLPLTNDIRIKYPTMVYQALE